MAKYFFLLYSLMITFAAAAKGVSRSPMEGDYHFSLSCSDDSDESLYETDPPDALPTTQISNEKEMSLTEREMMDHMQYDDPWGPKECKDVFDINAEDATLSPKESTTNIDTATLSMFTSTDGNRMDFGDSPTTFSTMEGYAGNELSESLNGSKTINIGELRNMTGTKVHSILKDFFNKRKRAMSRFDAVERQIKEKIVSGTCNEENLRLIDRWRYLVNVSCWNDGNSMASDILFPRELIPTAQELLGLENEQSVREKIEGLSPTQKTDRLKLRAHQMKGIRFMWSILAEGPVGKVPAVGCILAHTMGLGKTCQAIIFLHLFMQEIGLSNDGCVKQMKRLRKRVLIAVPKSTRCSWVDQFEMWSNFFPPSQRIELLCLTETSSAESRVKLFKSWITHGGVLLTGYEMLTKVYKVYKEKSDNKFTTSEYIDLLICDEAHRLKCENLQVALTLKNLNPLRRLLITGTPLQNYLKEYWVMVDFALSKYFNKDQFHHYFTNPIESSANWRATQDEVTVARTKTAALIQELKNFVQCYDSSILKQELPPLQEYVVFVQLTQMQAELHDEFTRLARRCISASNFLQTIACLRKICTHPQMLFSTVFNTGSRGKESQRNESSSGDGDLAAAFERYEDVLTADEGYRNLCQPPPGYIPTPQDGSKVYVALLIVKEAMKRGERTLLFTMYNKLLDFLEVAIKHMNDVWLEDGSITTPIRFCRLDGTRTEADRSYALKTFASCDGPNVFLVSMRAGGVGLTITAATRVIIMDGGFNPAEEKQAIGRAYRYGQTQPVFAYHLICHGTFEHRVFEHKLAKEWLFRTIVEEASLKRDALKGFNFKTVYEVLESGGTLPLRSQKVTQSQAESTKAIAAEDEVLAKVIPHILYAEVHSTFLQQDDEFDLTASECPYQEEGGWNNSHGYNSLNGHSGCSEQQLFTSGCKRSFTQARVANLDNLVERIIVSRTDTDPQLAQALRAIGYIKSCESDPVDDVLRKGLNRIEGRFGGEDGLTSHEYRNINEINDEGNVEVTGNTSGRHKIPRTLLHRKP